MGKQEWLNLPELHDDGRWEWLSVTTEKSRCFLEYTFVSSSRKISS